MIPRIKVKPHEYQWLDVHFLSYQDIDGQINNVDF